MVARRNKFSRHFAARQPVLNKQMSISSGVMHEKSFTHLGGSEAGELLQNASGSEKLPSLIISLASVVVILLLLSMVLVELFCGWSLCCYQRFMCYFGHLLVFCARNS
jgi:hypothetical protein